MDLKQRVRVFLDKNPTPDGWVRNLKQHIPVIGEVLANEELLSVVDGDNVVLTLKACEVCTEEQVRNLGCFPPDGLWITWGDCVPEIGRMMLAERLKELLSSQGVQQVPATWHVSFHWLSKKHVFGESITAAFRFLHERSGRQARRR